MWGRDLSIDDLLALKPGSFRIEAAADGRQIVTITRPDEPVERFVAPSPGIANQLRIRLADGLAGFIEGPR
jgi:hypothetical protein